MRLNEDVLVLILEELRYDKKTLYSCLLVNRTWCEKTVSILWRFLGRYNSIDNVNSMNILFNVIIKHLSKESKDLLKNQGIELFKETDQKKLLFDYINFWKCLDLQLLERMLSHIKNVEEIKIPIIRNEILKLFINENKKFISLTIPENLNCQLHRISGVEHCFSNLETLYCNDNTDQNILEELSKIIKSTKKFIFYIKQHNNNFGVITLIESQKGLNDVRFIYVKYNSSIRNVPFFKALEESLIKHIDTIQHLRIYWKPITKILSYLVNLLSLEIYSSNPYYNTNWNHLENLSLPVLKILKVQRVPSNILTSLIENTKGYITEISIVVDDKSLIRAIYQNCKNLRYLKLSLLNRNILELENLLINCKFLNGLVIDGYMFKWSELFEILYKSSPAGLFKFKFFFYYTRTPELESLKLFFDNWNKRIPMHPMLLRTIQMNQYVDVVQYFDLIEKYKTKGIVKDYYNDLYENDFEDFEWIQKKRKFILVQNFVD
ncbi:hypothetical protein RclHR1_08610004 [Rhizophagus clarus]|uniref:F-box domain-containing protein n=1 Tax=Rhizophagus clarus TaxID=94130 RepID=A0A2Z6SNK8_9GLOM|nr:hypothetical protein RclHR1_08610004 [Rhizophagus clarus]GES99095.1 hypothetical protein GLOIN_2v1768034 [Rhizophagus clarus]